MSATKLAADQNLITFSQGELIAKEGEPGGDLLIIRSGVAEVFRARDGQEIVLARVGAGEMLGVMTATNGGPRAASVRAKTAVTATRIEKAKVKELVGSIPKWASALIEDLVTRVVQTDELYEKSHLKLASSASIVGRIVTLATQIAEGFLPMAETLSHKNDDRTVSVDEVLERLSSIINEPYRDLRKIVDVFDEKDLVPWKSKARNSRCTVGELNNFAYFAKFVKDHRKTGKLSEYIGSVGIKDRKQLSAIAHLAEKIAPGKNPVSLTFIELADGLKKASITFEPHSMKEAHHFKFLELVSDGDTQKINFDPGTLLLTMQCLDTINALDLLEEGGSRINRQRSLVY